MSSKSMDAKKQQQVNIRLDPKTHRKVRVALAKKGKTITGVIRECLETVAASEK